MAVKAIITDWEPTSSEDGLKIGSSTFSDDIWDLSPLIPLKSLSECYKKLSFYGIESDSLKLTIKRYCYYRLGRVKARSVIADMVAMSHFVAYCKENDITSLSEIKKETLLDFALWLKATRGVAKVTGYKAFFVVEDMIRVGQIKHWDVPEQDVLTGATAREIWGSGRDKNSKRKYEPIPDDIFDKIVNAALNYKAYHSDNVITKCGILIQSQTGLRIGEVLSLKSGCLHEPKNGPAYIEVEISKTSKGEPIIHHVMANEIVVNAVKELEASTAELRAESKLEELFLVKSQGIKVAKTYNWSQRRLKSFIRRCDIRDKNGELYHLQSHQFRATFVKHLIMKNIPIAYVMNQFQHVSIEMTSHYLTLQEHEIKEIYSKAIMKPEAIIAGNGAERIKKVTEPLFKGKTEAEVEEIITGLSKSMTFNPLPGGMCLYDYRRGNCANGDGCFFYNCPNFVTEASFLPVLKKEMELMEKEMRRTEELGYERQWQIQNSRYKCLRPLVEKLEETSYE